MALRKNEINTREVEQQVTEIFEINFVLEKQYHEMAAAQVAKKLKDKRKQRTIEGIFKKVGPVTIKLFGFLRNGLMVPLTKYWNLIFKFFRYRIIFREC